MTSQKLTSIKQLKQLQQDFYAAIFNPNTETIAQASKYVQGTAAMDEADRLSVYRGSILGGITSALMNIFPVCVKLVGENYFTHMVSGYLKAYPSNSPDIGNYGEHLPAYIAEFKPARELVYLSDVAQLEWHWHTAFNAVDDQFYAQSFFPLSELEQLTADEYPLIRFCTVSSASLLKSAYPVHRIWQVNQHDFEGDPTVNLDDGGICLVTWRSADFGMRIDVLSEDEYTFLAALLAHESINTITDIPFSQDLNGIIQRCIQTGLIAGFRMVEQQGIP